MPYLPLLLSLLLCTSVRAQNPAPTPSDTTTRYATPADPATARHGRAQPRGNHSNLAVTPGGHLWIATKTGEVYNAAGPGKNWNRRYFEQSEWQGETFENVLFFNDSVGVLTGYLHDKNNQDHLYRTTDGGRTWHRQPLEKGKWVDVAVALPSGRAWLASADQVMYRTTDAGATWEEIDRPENTTNQRIVQLDFASDQDGLAGTSWNRLYLTRDAGDSWTILPTPLDQKRYSPASEKHRPRINGVHHSGKTLLVHQGEKWYQSPAGAIDWQPLGKHVQVLDYDAVNERLYVVRNDTLLTTPLPITGDYSVVPVQLPHLAAVTASAGRLYFMSAGSAGYVAGNELITADMFGDTLPIAGVVADTMWDGVQWGHAGRDLYQEMEDGQWKRRFVFPEPIEAILPQGEGLATVRTTEGNYHFDPKDGSLTPFEVRQTIQFPPVADIREITFKEVHSGCFHFNEEVRVFRPGKGGFQEKQGKGTISTAELAALLKDVLMPLPTNRLRQLPLVPGAEAAYDRLLIEAIAAKRKAREFPSNSLERIRDPQRMKGYANLPAERHLTDAFSLALAGDDYWSTSTVAHQITITFRAGPPLVLHFQTSNGTPDALTWLADYGSDQFWVVSGRVRDFYLSRLAPGERVEADGVLLFRMARHWALERQ